MRLRRALGTYCTALVSASGPQGRRDNAGLHNSGVAHRARCLDLLSTACDTKLLQDKSSFNAPAAQPNRVCRSQQLFSSKITIVLPTTLLTELRAHWRAVPA